MASPPRSIVDRVSDAVWGPRLSALPGWSARTLGLVRLVLTLIRDLWAGELNLRAMSLAYVTLVCCNSIAVFLIMSRNGIAAMMIIYTLYLLFNHKRLAVVVIIAITSIGASMDSILQLPFMHHLLVRLRFVGYVATAPRSVIWRVAWDHIKVHPMLGVGPGGPKKALAVIDINHAHNTFVQVALETGIPSAVIFGVLVLLLLRLPVRTIMKQTEHFVMTLPILAYTIYSWTAMPLTYSGMTFLLAACVHEARIAIQRQLAEQSRRSRQALPARRPRLAA